MSNTCCTLHSDRTAGAAPVINQVASVSHSCIDNNTPEIVSERFSKLSDTLLCVPQFGNADITNMQSIFLRAASAVPDVMLDRYHEESVSVKMCGETGTLSLVHPQISAWRQGHPYLFMTFKHNGVWLTKVQDKGNGVCVKQDVVARLYTPEGELFVGTNRCHNPQQVCPRDVYGMKSGEGYHLCKEVCRQEAHAEVDAITQAGEKAKGAIIYLTGHQYACGDCQEVARNAGATIELRHDN